MALDQFREITTKREWRARALALIDTPRPQTSAAEFGTYWIEGGHHIREQIADDRILASLLRHLLVPYEGGPVTLFRGENLDRWKAGCIGLTWTTDLDIAKMFGRGLNAVRSGGVLLRGHFGPEAIIAGPNVHSNYLGEGQFTIDPTHAQELIVIEDFPPSA